MSESTELESGWTDTDPSIAVEQDKQNKRKNDVGFKEFLENGYCKKKVLFE